MGTMKVSAVFYQDCIKAIIAAILVTKLHRSLKHIITPALRMENIQMRDDKGKKHVNSVFLLLFWNVSYGYYKRIQKHASLQPNKIAIKENDRVLTYKVVRISL